MPDPVNRSVAFYLRIKCISEPSLAHDIHFFYCHKYKELLTNSAPYQYNLFD